MRWSRRTARTRGCLIRGRLLRRGNRRGRRRYCLYWLCWRSAGGGGVCAVRAPSPEDDSEDYYDCGDDKNSPRNFGPGRAGETVSTRAYIFGARKLQFGEFPDLFRGLRFCHELVGFGLVGPDQTRFLWHSVACLTSLLRLPDLVGINLSLAQAGKILCDGFLVVESEMLGVGADESLVEDAARQQIEVLFFDSLQHARADLGDVGNVIEREFFLLTRLAEFVSEFAHSGSPGDDGNIIGQAAWGCHCQEFYTWVTKVAAVRSLYRSQGQHSARDPFDFAQGRLFPPPEVRLRSG